MPTAQEIIEALQLQAHTVEGGYFRETYRSPDEIPEDQLPSPFQGRGARSRSTAIYFLITPESFSEMHRLPAEEVYHVYLGGPARMLQIDPDGTHREIVLGTDPLAGHVPQLVVPGGVWQGTRLEPGGDFILMGTTMAPGFDYRDYEQGTFAGLVDLAPEAASLLRKLTRA